MVQGECIMCRTAITENLPDPFAGVNMISMSGSLQQPIGQGAKQ